MRKKLTLLAAVATTGMALSGGCGFDFGSGGLLAIIGGVVVAGLLLGAFTSAA